MPTGVYERKKYSDGKCFSKAARQRMSAAHKGKVGYWRSKKRSVKSIRKRTATRRRKDGYRAWNKGKQGVQFHSEATKIKMSIARKGQIPWNKGKHHSEKSKQKIAINNACYWLGKRRPDLSRIMQGNRNGKGYKGSLKHKRIVNEVADWLDDGKNKVETEKQVSVKQGYRVIDVLVNDKVCFEIGDCRQKKIQELTQNGFAVVHMPYSCF